MRVPMSSPNLTDADIVAVNQVLKTHHLSLGPRIEAFEDAFASTVGTHNAPLVIEDDAVIGAGACVTKPVPSRATVTGVPAKPLTSTA